jgi:NAD-dependent DNA ligase
MEEKLNSLSPEELKKYFKTADLETLHNIKTEVDDLYYNTGESYLDDYTYDMLKDILAKRDPSFVPPVGATIRTGSNRVEIPFWLGSLDKVTPEEPEVLARWKKQNSSKSYVVSEKLDGVSCLVVSKDGKISLYTRGDGVVGADISHLLRYFKTIPKDLQDIAVRGELIIKKSTFIEKYLRKGEKESKTASKTASKTYKNPRNMVASLVGVKTSRAGFEDVDFIAYEIVGDETMPPPLEQLKTLKKLGFTVAKHEALSDVTVENLSKLLLKFRDKSQYEIDGIVIATDQPYDRNISGNPDYMIAFKMLLGDAIRETRVIEIEWNVSKWGQLKPVVILEPVDLSGVTINRATAYHGKYIYDNKLGPGAIVKITRSKEVIPHIVDVVKGASEPQMPKNYVWDKNRVNIKSTGEDDSTVCIKLITSFFAKLGIKHVSEATITKMYESGLDNLLKILEASKERLMKVPGIQERSADRIHTNIHSGFKNVKLSLFLGASGIFGFGIGVKRIESLLLAIPDLLTVYKKKTKKQLVQDIMAVEGFSEITAENIVNNIKYANILLENTKKYMTIKEDKRVSNDMSGHKYVMTGFRDKALEDAINQRGGKISSSVSKNTTALIVKQRGEKITGKLAKAQELGVEIVARDDFMERL